MSGDDWRIETDADAYFTHRQKQLDVADRRPVPRKASDLGLGPGISAGAVRLDDYNDLLATFNGYYSSEVGAINAPNAIEPFVGHVVSDAALGGWQVFSGLSTGSEYSRKFDRSPTDPEAIAWGPWSLRQRIPPSVFGSQEVDTAAASGTATTLTAPTITTIGDASCYERSSVGIRVRRQGVYTGSVQVGDRVGSTVSNVYLLAPAGDTTKFIGQLTVPLAPTVHIPFTVWATDTEQGFSVVVLHTSGDARSLWYRFSCTRVGDAI